MGKGRSMADKNADYYYQLLEMIDEGPHEVSKWEADFIESHLEERRGRFTENQIRVIREMAEKYGIDL